MSTDFESKKLLTAPLEDLAIYSDIFLSWDDFYHSHFADEAQLRSHRLFRSAQLPMRKSRRESGQEHLDLNDVLLIFWQC